MFCISLLEFCMVANKYFIFVQIRMTFCWINKEYKVGSCCAGDLFALPLSQVLQCNFQSVTIADGF